MVWDSILNYFLTRFGFRNEGKRPRTEDEDEDDDLNEPSCKQRKLSLKEERFISTEQFLCPAPNWRNSKRRVMASSSQQQRKNAYYLHVKLSSRHAPAQSDTTTPLISKPGCSWFGESKENVHDVSDNEDVEEIDMWQDTNTLRKYPVYRGGIAAKETNASATSNKAEGKDNDDDDIEVVKVVPSHKKEVEQSGNSICIFQTPSTKLSSLSRLTTDSSGLSRSPLLLQRLKTLRSKSSQGSSGSRSGTSSRSSRIEDKKSQLAINESFRLEDKMKYSELLQKFTNVPIQSPFAAARVPNFRSTLKRDLTLSRGRPSIIKEVIDLTKPQGSRTLPQRKYVDLRRDRESQPSTSASKQDSDEPQIVGASYVKSNSLDEVLKLNYYCDEHLIVSINEKYKQKKEALEKQEEEERLKAEHFQKRRKKLEVESLERLTNYMKITDAIYEDVSLEEKAILPELTPDMQKVIDNALIPKPPNEVIVECFGLPIKRHDMQTLAGLNWLNDEVINYYMELLKERGKLQNYPSVYSFNTFFYPRLLTGGHSALKRWTRKVDIFSHDVIIVPVHLGVHWCMAAIDFRNRTVKYYDSMGAPNNKCLQSLIKYLQDEHDDKKKQPFGTTGWQTENVQNIPQQMNGSDCGMFACTYAEFICRNAPFTFTQQDMPYFRRKMVYEICTRKLLM